MAEIEKQRTDERIAKRLARAGLCSRREAERWITAGRIAVDGKVITSPATNVTARSRVAVDGEPLPDAAPARLWRYHKPAGLVTSHRDERGRPTVFDKLPADLPRVVSVGRLDIASEGLLLLTNDGELARHMELPATGWNRRYRVRAFGDVTAERLLALGQGVTIDGIKYRPIEAKVDRKQGDNVWLTMSLVEGRNREVRKVCEHLGLKVNRLIRIAYGPFQLGTLKRGEIASVRPSVLRDQLGGAIGKTIGRHANRRG